MSQLPACIECVDDVEKFGVILASSFCKKEVSWDSLIIESCRNAVGKLVESNGVNRGSWVLKKLLSWTEPVHVISLRDEMRSVLLSVIEQEATWIGKTAVDRDEAFRIILSTIEKRVDEDSDHQLVKRLQIIPSEPDTDHLVELLKSLFCDLE